MLIDQLQTLCQRLSSQGWQALLQSVGGLNILQESAGALATELARPLDAINRKAPGFEDFNPAGNQGITAGVPSASLLYHALASPGVKRSTLTYPTLADLDLVENYIFAQVGATFQTFRGMAKGRPLGVVTFAYDYRTAPETVQGAYADLVLSRTGVQRVGNAGPAYVPELRAFTPWQRTDGDAVIRVMPARYAAFLAVKLPGKTDVLGADVEFGPLDKDLTKLVNNDPNLVALLPSPYVTHKAPVDDTTDFWVPLHKLFPGPECLVDFVEEDALTVDFDVQHRNMKLQRQWQQLGSMGYPLDTVTNDVNLPPFIREDGLATRSTQAGDGPCLIVPTTHVAFNAQVNKPGSDDPLPFPVMKGYDAFVKSKRGKNAYGWYWSSLYIPTAVGGGHRAPEYVNVRGQLDDLGAVEDLNQKPDLENYLETNKFNAQTLEDYTADGWIAPQVPQLMTDIDPPNFVAAYSLVTAPAFFPFVRQRDLMQWSFDRFVNPVAEWAKVWNVFPFALCHDRIAPNVELRHSGFHIGDVSVSAIVSLPAPKVDRIAPATSVGLLRASFLPDSAAGTYAPGWETSFDRTALGKPFLAAYGLGSPFAEDAMICSALGTFWPGPAPDTSRLFGEMPYRIEAPLTETEVGIPNPTTSWDGTPVPVFTDSGNVLFMNPAYVDYTRNATLRVKPFMGIDTREFTGRVLSMYNALSAVGVKPRGDDEVYQENAAVWRVLMFQQSSTNDQGFHNAWRSAKPGIRAAGPIYYMRLAKIDIDPNVQDEAAFNQYQGSIEQDCDFYIYTFSGGSLRSPDGKTKWKFFGAPR